MRKPSVFKAIILVGGWGTRLRPLTSTMPKPLVPFCNRPMLKYQVEKLVAAGVTEVVLALNYHSDMIMAECKDYEREFNIKMIYSKEDTPLGTAGPLALARRHLQGSTFFVMNSDICCDADLNKMREDYLEGSCAASIMTFPVEDPTRYGLIRCDGEKIVSFVEKPKHKVGGGPWLINAGTYIFSESVLELIELREMSLENEVFPIIAHSGRLRQYLHTGFWMDIGQIADYLTGQGLLLRSSLIQKHGYEVCFTSPGLVIIKNVVIGKNVKIGKNVILKNCAIFDNSTIGNNTVIKDSVIGWDCVIGNGCRIVDTSVLGQCVVVGPNVTLRALKIDPSEIITEENVEEYLVQAMPAVKTL